MSASKSVHSATSSMAFILHALLKRCRVLMAFRAGGFARRNVAVPAARMVALAARHVDLGHVGAHRLRHRLGGFVAFATIAILGEVRPVAEIVEAEGRPGAAREGQRLVFLDVTGVAVAEVLSRLTGLRRLSRLGRLI